MPALAARARTLERIAYAVMPVRAVGVTLVIRGYVEPRWALGLLAAGFAGGVCLLAAGMMELRARRAAGFARGGAAG